MIWRRFVRSASLSFWTAPFRSTGTTSCYSQVLSQSHICPCSSFALVWCWLPNYWACPQPSPLVVGVLFLIVLYLVGVAAAQSGTIIAVSAVHLSQPITIREAYSRVREMLGRIVLLTIGLGMGIGIGLVLLIVPGIILTLMWALAVPVAVLEDASLGEAMSRSRALTAGHRGRVFRDLSSVLHAERYRGSSSGFPIGRGRDS